MNPTTIANNGDRFLCATSNAGSLTLELLTAGYQSIGRIALDADAEARLLSLLTERRDQAVTTTPALSEGTAAVVANLVEYTIEREYGVAGAEDAAGAATVTALAGLQLDLRAQFIGRTGGDAGLIGYAQSTLRILVRDGLEARRCQCHTINSVCPHGIGARCAGHYEADVPPIDGARLCGTCHVAVYQARS